LNAGLTQVLTDGTNTYLYGNGRISQHATQTEYFLGDALGSVRQLADTAGAVTLTQSYAPYGETVSSIGSGASAYQFTGESLDANGLTYLRARYYNSGDGRFLSRDTWNGNYNRPLSLNRWGYVEGNPINLTDASGHFPAIPDLLLMSANNAIMFSKSAYSKLGPLCLGLGSGYNNNPDTMGVEDILIEFACEVGKVNRRFGETAVLTQELKRSIAIEKLKKSFFLSGKMIDQGTAYFDNAEVVDATLDAFRERKLSILHLLGSFDYSIIRQHDGRVTFTIKNVTELSSGTRIPPILGGVHPKDVDSAVTVEQIVRRKPLLGRVPVISLIQIYPIISILDIQTREQTTGFGGGGTVSQTFVWDEQLSLVCDPYSILGID